MSHANYAALKTLAAGVFILNQQITHVLKSA